MGADAVIYFTTKTLDDQTLKLWAFEIAIAVGSNFLIKRPDPSSPVFREGCRAIEPAKDNPYGIHQVDGETLYELSAWFRFYGPGCERGDWPLIAGTLYWLIHRLHIDDADPIGQVYYGSTDADTLDEVNWGWYNDMWRYWAEEGKLPYYGDPRAGPTVKDGITPPYCDFCGFHANINMWGSGKIRGAECMCCRQHWRTDDGIAWRETDKDHSP